MTKLLFFIISILSPAIAMNLEVLYEWKYVDFEWSSLLQKQWALRKGDYNASSCILYDVDKAPDGRTFVTSVRQKGVPASLMTITKEKGNGGPLLRPYPNWSWHFRSRCEGITGVYRIFIKCNHLIVLDTGKIGNDAVCNAQLLIFDLWNDRLVKRVRIPNNIATNNTGSGLLTTLTVTSSNCLNFLHNMMVFISDAEGYGLVVYNAHFPERLCRINSQSMRPTDTNFTIDGQSFSLDDGILGLTVVNEDLYYAPLASRSIYRMDVAKIETCLLDQTQIDQDTQLAGTLSGQTGPIASQYNTIFFSDIPNTSILCANTSSKRINASNSEMIAQDPVKLQFPSGLKVTGWTKYDHDGSLMILTNRYQRIATDTLNLKEINFRVLSISMAEIKNQTHCF